MEHAGIEYFLTVIYKNLKPQLKKIEFDEEYKKYESMYCSNKKIQIKEFQEVYDEDVEDLSEK